MRHEGRWMRWEMRGMMKTHMRRGRRPEDPLEDFEALLDRLIGGGTEVSEFSGIACDVCALAEARSR